MKRGYTLAEVLVTIGVIGIVASMTLPILIKKYQYKQWTEQLKKSYATLNQGFKKMLADDEVFNLADTEVFKSIGGTCHEFNNPESTNCKNFFINMKKYFKIVDIKRIDYKYNTLNDDREYNNNGNNVIFLADGTLIYSYEFLKFPGTAYYLGHFRIDINGLKKPNKIGRDIFDFEIGPDGVYPVGGTNINFRKASSWRDGSVDSAVMCELGSRRVSGYGCAARVLETGNMDYTVRVNQNSFGSDH